MLRKQLRSNRPRNCNSTTLGPTGLLSSTPFAANLSSTLAIVVPWHTAAPAAPYMNTTSTSIESPITVATDIFPSDILNGCDTEEELSKLRRKWDIIPNPDPPGDETAHLRTGHCEEEGFWNCIDGKKFQQCKHKYWSFPQRMALGTKCVLGLRERLAIDSIRSGRCDDDGSCNCVNGNIVQLCACGRWSDAELLPTGVRCINPGVADTCELES